MASVSFHLTNVLPTSGETGGVYFVKDGRLFVAESENSYVEINPVKVVSTLPTQGISNKLYALEENDSLNLKIWVEGEGYKDVTLSLPDGSATQKGIVQLTNDLNGQSETLALTQKGANDLNTALNAHANNVDIHVTVADKASWNEHLDKVASDTELGHVKVDNTTITSNNGVISAVTKGYTLESQYIIVDTVANQVTFDAVLTGVNYSKSTIDVLDSGLFIIPNVDYTLSYNEANETLTVTLINPRTFDNKFVVKATEVIAL